MSYTIVGTAYVHRYKIDEESGHDRWYHETLDLQVSVDAPLAAGQLDEDFHWTVAGYDWDDLPDKEGYYAVQYAATLNFYQSWEGEWDCSADVHWSKISELTPEEVAFILGEEAPKEESFVQLLGDSVEEIQKL